MKKKAWIIAGSVTLGVILLIILLSFTLFSLRTVKVDYKTSHSYITATSEEIIKTSKIKYGGTVFFRNKQKYIQNIEKEYPYVKVINIETVFPSKMIIHISERQEVYVIEIGEHFYICDEEFKVLKITDSFSSNQSNAILLKGINVKEKNYAESDKLIIDGFANIYKGLYENNRTLGEQQYLIKDIEFSKENVEVLEKEILNAQINLFNGQKFIIKNCTYGLKYKMNMFIEVYSKSFEFIGKEIILEDEETKVLTEEDIQNATFIINNYYDYTSHGEKDCFFDIILQS